MLGQESTGCFERQKEGQGSVTQSWGAFEARLYRMGLTGGSGEKVFQVEGTEFQKTQK